MKTFARSPVPMLRRFREKWAASVGGCVRPVVLLGVSVLLACQNVEQVSHAAPEPGAAAVASADPRATAAGLEILEQGGNAFDAAVAVAAALSVVEPASSGLGGGGFLLLYISETDSYNFIDAREVAPAAATVSTFLDDSGQPLKGASIDGPLAAGIPGQPAGLVFLAEKYGRLSLARSLAPAIRYAEEGFAITRRSLLGLRFRKSVYLRWPAFPAVFLPDGDVPAEGTIIKQPDLAATLRRLADAGHDGYYSGETARLLVDGVRAAGGIWTAEDLSDYRVVERSPLISEYRGVRIVSAPPPSSGGIALANLFNILSGYDLAGMDSVQRKHLLIEGMRRVYRDRAEFLGDPDFVPVPVERLTSPWYADGQRTSIRLDRSTPSSMLAPIDSDGSEGLQTTHFSVLDVDGNRVAATLTINTWFGSGFMAPGTGVILNNEMDDFSIKPGVPNEFELLGTEVNAVAPRKRPLSSMSPTFLESDRGVAILGTPGGSRIISMVLLSGLAWVDGADAQQMVNLKRFHHQYSPDYVSFEEGALSDEERQRLEALGHELSLTRRPYGNMNVVTWDYQSNQVDAATDPRGEGEGRIY